MSKVSNNKKVVILIVIIAVLAVAIIFAMNSPKNDTANYSDKAVAGSEQPSEESMVMEDSATVKVQIPEGNAGQKGDPAQNDTATKDEENASKQNDNAEE